MRFLLTLLTTLALAFGLPSATRADPADIAAAARSVVRVVLIGSNGDQLGLIGHGSGVAIAPDIVLTNAHVVAPLAQDDTIRVGVVPSEGNGGSFARVLAVSPGNDLALLRLDRPGLPPATLFSGSAGDGSDVYAIGYPGNVDQAQGLDIADIMTPTTPVKTHGNVSAGRSSKQFDTILHTASIGAGNSGGPLVDACGRVVGINSFGTLSGDGDSEFYFAVSIREVSRFLNGAGIQARTTGVACRSLADLDRAEAERRAGEDARNAEAARDAAFRQSMSAEQAMRTAQYAVIAERENHIALALAALVFAVAAAAGAAWLRQQERAREMKIAGGGAAALALVALFAWLTRPPFADVETRAAALASAGTGQGGKAAPARKGMAGALVCVLDSARSRLTVSDGADVRFTWRPDGCVNGSTQYGQASGGWLRVLMPGSDRIVSVVRFDPASGTYSNARTMLGLDDLSKLRAARSGARAPACGAPASEIAAFGEAQAALATALPDAPNERLIYRCAPAAGAGS